MTSHDLDICELPNIEAYGFPFGRPLERVEQTDKTPKKVFVLGVYPSAVHARWIGPDGKVRVAALAVDNEPRIFWRGEPDEAARIIAGIPVPPGAGRLEPADPAFNGPSGRALDELYLRPLGITREDAWLCDLFPMSCANPAQLRAIARAYTPVREAWGLPRMTPARLPPDLCPPARRENIRWKILRSEAEVLIVLGDKPIRHFLRHVVDLPHRSLAAFGKTPETYGRRHRVQLGGRMIDVIPLVHPRQAAGLGEANAEWGELHRGWAERTTPLR